MAEVLGVERRKAMAVGKEHCKERSGRWPACELWIWFRQMNLQLPWRTWFTRPFHSEVNQAEDKTLWRCVRQMKLQLPWRTRFTRPVYLVNQADDQMHLEEKQADDQGTEMHSSVLPALIYHLARQWLPWRTRITSAMLLEENEAEDHGTHIYSSLLPGLPHDIALRCLVRLPLGFLGVARTVSKGWNDAIQPKNIVTLRQQAGLSTDLVFFFAEKNIAGTLHRFLLAIDPSLHAVSEIPCPDCLLNHEVRFEMILGMNGEVLWLGKDEMLDKPLPQLFVLDYLRARWRSLPSMAKLTGGNFALISVTIGGYAYFTGGWSSRDFDNVNKEVECLDLTTKHWRTIPNRHYLRLYGLGLVMDGHFVVFAGLPRSNPAEQWHPETGEWQVMEDIWSKGVKVKRPYFTVVEGKLFAIWSKTTVATFEPLTNSWLQLGRITAAAAKIQALLCVGDKLWAFLETDDQDSNMENSLLWIYVACVSEVPARWERLPLCIKVLQGSSRAISMKLAETV